VMEVLLDEIRDGRRPVAAFCRSRRHAAGTRPPGSQTHRGISGAEARVSVFPFDCVLSRRGDRRVGTSLLANPIRCRHHHIFGPRPRPLLRWGANGALRQVSMRRNELAREP
jgi:hypothetical protein